MCDVYRNNELNFSISNPYHHRFPPWKKVYYRSYTYISRVPIIFFKENQSFLYFASVYYISLKV